MAHLSLKAFKSEIAMSVLWIYLAFSLGAMVGFGFFAALQVSREQDERQRKLSEGYQSEGYHVATGC
jgi:hypothetical protein